MQLIQLVPLLLVLQFHAFRIQRLHHRSSFVKHYLGLNSLDFSDTPDSNESATQPTMAEEGKSTEEDDKDSIEDIIIKSSQLDTSSISIRPDDLKQERDLELILAERAKRFYDPTTIRREKEKVILLAVDAKKDHHSYHLRPSETFSFEESLSELSELVGTAGLMVCGCCVQRLTSPNIRTYIGSGKVDEVAAMLNSTGARVIVIDDDLTPKQQRNLEDSFTQLGIPEIKVLDRTAVILDIFAQHAQSREGQLQVELAMLEYRLTRGPRATGSDYDSGSGFRGPGESKLETDKRLIRDRIVLVKREIEGLGHQRSQHRKGR